MGTIIDRHRNFTIFDKLSTRYSKFIIYVIDENLKLKEYNLTTSHFNSESNLDCDEKNKKFYLYFYKSIKEGLDSPRKVLADVYIDENTFISLDGHICNTFDYEKTNEKILVTNILFDIESNTK